MNKLNQYHMAQFGIFVISFLVFFAAFYAEYVLGFEPCPLCLMQRLCTGLILLTSVVALWMSFFNQRRWVWVVQMVVAVLGLYFASRQLWIQHLPEDLSGTCLPGLQLLFRYFSWSDLFKAMFWGTGECGHEGATLMGLSLPMGSMVYFLGVLLLDVFVMRRRK